MTNVTCKYVEENLDRLADGEMSEPERAQLEVHLAVCDSCRESAALWSGLEVAAAEAELEPLAERLERLQARGIWTPTEGTSLSRGSTSSW